MLQRRSEQVAECYRRAADARIRAERVDDQSSRQDFLDIERRWLRLARSFEYSERLDRFVGERDRRRNDQH